jgi:pre-mRNA-splicing factor RBM22/SLT11
LYFSLSLFVQHLELEAPEDQDIVTLWLGNVDPELTESDVRSALYPYGLIHSVHLLKTARCAFVEYVDRGTAENAAKQMYNALLINGKPISVNWAKPKVQGNASETSSSVSSSAQTGLMLPPPGMERAQLSAYQLQNMPAPVTGAVRPREPPTPSESQQQESNKRVATEGGPSGEGGSYITSFSSAPPPVPQQYQQQQFNQQQHFNQFQHRCPPPPQHMPGGFRPPPPPKIQYPSMNPTRMGASI